MYPMESNRSQRITALYERESARLQRHVARRVHGVDADIADDACSFAWAKLVSRTDIDPDDVATFGWLAVVAVHASWDLAGRETASFEAVERSRSPTT
jgi:DNA-directed RNA polymerase specialized sigma24 family protein